MSHASNDPISVAAMALAAGRKALSDYSHPKSPHKYTQPQLFALLILKQLFKIDYRGVVLWVERWRELREALGLTRVPHYSTLCLAEQRLLKKGALSDYWTPRSTRPAKTA